MAVVKEARKTAKERVKINLPVNALLFSECTYIVRRPLAASLKNFAGDEDSTLPRIIFVYMHIAYYELQFLSWEFTNF